MSKKPKVRTGRPSKYTPELVEEIAERLAKGEPLAAICRDAHMPHDSTVRDWMEARPEVSLAIARGRESGEEWLMAECLQIADTTKEGVRVKITDDGMETVREDMLGHRKLQIDTRLKLLAKWNPKKYGDKMDLTSGGDKLPPPISGMVITAARPDEPSV